MKHLACLEAENRPQDKGKKGTEAELRSEGAFSAAGDSRSGESHCWWFSGDAEALLLLEVEGGPWSVGVGLRQASAVFIQHSRESKVPQKHNVALMVLR